LAEVGNISARVSLDTAEFRQGIKQMSQSMAIAREEFKQATSGLDRVEDAMEIAKAKAKMLEQQIELQSKTVEQLNEQYEKAKDQYGENSRQATQYRLTLERARTSLTQMRTDLNRTNEEMENLNNTTDEGGDSAEGFSGKLSGLADSAKTAALGLAAVGAAAIGGAMTKGVMSADELSKSLNNLQTQTGATDKQMIKFKDGKIFMKLILENHLKI
jgi:chromosome segregation ATPase